MAWDHTQELWHYHCEQSSSQDKLFFFQYFLLFLEDSFHLTENAEVGPSNNSNPSY